jgi:hypothetical protein
VVLFLFSLFASPIVCIFPRQLNGQGGCQANHVSFMLRVNASSAHDAGFHMQEEAVEVGTTGDSSKTITIAMEDGTIMVVVVVGAEGTMNGVIKAVVAVGAEGTTGGSNKITTTTMVGGVMVVVAVAGMKAIAGSNNKTTTTIMVVDGAE